MTVSLATVVAPLLWTAMLAAVWPAVQVALFAARFGGVDGERLVESAVFLPMGALGGGALVWFWRRARGRTGRAGAMAGYVLATPVALVGSLMGGLVLPPLVGTLLLGGVPLVAGTGIGYLVGNSIGSSVGPWAGSSAGSSQSNSQRIGVENG